MPERSEGMAEREGFEPPEPLPVQWFSRPPPSTTRPSLRTGIIARNPAGTASAETWNTTRSNDVFLGEQTGRLLRSRVRRVGVRRVDISGSFPRSVLAPQDGLDWIFKG